MTRISVIICSHNPRRDYLNRVLASLKAQTLDRSEWELLLVDNASTEPIAGRYDFSWHPNTAIIRENELGLMPARLRGIKETSTGLLVFLDDDTLLVPDYLERACDILQGYPHLAVFGSGVVEPEFEVPPPRELTEMLPLLAVRWVRQPLWTNNPRDIGCVPWGGGLCVTRTAATAYTRLVERLQISHFLGRRGRRLFCGEDDVFSWVCADMGRGFGVFPELRLTHLIKKARLNRSYVLRLVHDHAYSHALLKYLLAGEKQSVSGGSSLARILLHGLRRGVFSMQCQLAAARGIRRAARFLADEGMHPIDVHVSCDLQAVAGHANGGRGLSLPGSATAHRSPSASQARASSGL